MLRRTLLLAALVALTGCDKLITDKPKDKIAVAETKAKARDYPSAIRIYESALDGTAETGEIHYRLAVIYDDKLRRPADALQALEAVGPMSEYGRMEETWARLRAHAQLRNAEGVRTALAYLEEHRNVSLDVYLDALVDANEIDKAAELLIELLADSRARIGILVRLQRYAESPLTPVGMERKARWDVLVARFDVQAAVARVGRLESYPFLRRLQSVE